MASVGGCIPVMMKGCPVRHPASPARTCLSAPRPRSAGRAVGQRLGFLFSRLRTWLLLAIALPRARLLFIVSPWPLTAETVSPHGKTAYQAGWAVARVSGRVSRRTGH
jgi:hypothetical protein